MARRRGLLAAPDPVSRDTRIPQKQLPRPRGRGSRFFAARGAILPQADVKRLLDQLIAATITRDRKLPPARKRRREYEI